MPNEADHTFAIMAYQDSEYLVDCINAVRKQTMKSRVIMTSSTPSEYQERTAEQYGIPFIVNPERKSFAGDLNFAYAQAETQYVTLCHQDDILLPVILNPA